MLTIDGSGGACTLQDDLTTTGALTVTAGTLTAGAHNVTIGGGLTLNGGTFNASSGISLGGPGAFTRSSGTFNANGGTFFFDGTSTLTAQPSGARSWPTSRSASTCRAASSGTGSWTRPPARRRGQQLGQREHRDLARWRIPDGLGAAGAITFTDAEAITLDGTSGYVTLGTTNLPANNAAQSISLWYKGTPNGGNQNMLSDEQRVVYSAVQLGFRGSTLIAWSWGGATLISTTATNDSNWHHAVYTYDGTSNKIYVDGSLAASGTSKPTRPTATRPTSAPTTRAASCSAGRWTTFGSIAARLRRRRGTFCRRLSSLDHGGDTNLQRRLRLSGTSTWWRGRSRERDVQRRRQLDQPGRGPSPIWPVTMTVDLRRGDEHLERRKVRGVHRQRQRRNYKLADNLCVTTRDLTRLAPARSAGRSAIT